MESAQGPRRRPKRTAALRSRPELTRDLEIAARLGGLSLEQFYDHPDAEDHIAAWEIEAGVCKLHGGPRSECPDDTKDWFPQRHICYPEMQLEAARGLYAELHKDKPYHDGTFTLWAEHRSADRPFHFNDGVTIWLSPVELNPDDNFLGGGSVGGEVSEQPPQG